MFVALPGFTHHGARFAPEAVAAGAVAVLTDEAGAQRRREAAEAAVGRYDWSVVADEILDVYDMALSTAHTRVSPAWSRPTIVGRLRGVLEDRDRD